jgi:cytochrome c peroxidase
MKRGIVSMMALLAMALFVQLSEKLNAEDDTALLKQAQALFKPLPQALGAVDEPISSARVTLGRMLFFDPRWTLEGNVSCATCHQPALYGTDALTKAIGVQHRRHRRNAPTVLNAGLNFIQHWNGDRKDLEDQVEQALIGALSSGHSNPATVVARIEAIGGYAPLFRRAFPDEVKPITSASIGKAISAYERTLLTPAPFDSYLRGSTEAISPIARSGLRRFIEVGCASCHNGAGIGGQMFQKFGVREDYWKATGSSEVDKGRFDFTKDQGHLYLFKVPSLRNVAMTPPYFHDGSVPTLDEAVKVMGRVQLGVPLTDTEVAEIVALLGTLTGPLTANFATAPTLPPVIKREP